MESLDNSTTVEEIVDSLVQEIDNELLQTFEDGATTEEDKQDTYQLPLQDIGEETMEMIVNYNTRVNSDSLLTNNAVLLSDNNDEEDSVDSVVVKEDTLDTVSTSDMDICEVEFSSLKRRVGEGSLPPPQEGSDVAGDEKIDKSRPILQETKPTEKADALYGIGIINLPPLPENKPMFRNSSLARLLDDSVDSGTQLDSTKDYLPLTSQTSKQGSLISPALSDNSQFTKYTNSTMASSPAMTTSTKFTPIFKFKPRTVSQCKIYQPRNVSIHSALPGDQSIIIPNSLDHEDNSLDSIVVPYREIIKSLNLQLGKTRPIDKSVHDFNRSITEEQTYLLDEDEIEFSFDDLLNKLDQLGNDSDIITLPEDSMDSVKVSPVAIDGNQSEEKIILPESRHVSSPFKIRNHVTEEVMQKSSSISQHDEDNVTTPNENIQQDEIIAHEKLRDDGVLYVNVLNLQNFKIEGAKHRNTQYCLEFKQGNKIIHTTSWSAVLNKTNVPISKQFGFIINEEFKSFGNNRLEVAVRLQYDKLSKQTIEVRRKVTIGKRFPFGKKKYAYETAFIDKPLEVDPWSNITDASGRYAVCDIEMDQRFLNSIEFNTQRIPLNMIDRSNHSITRLNDSGTLNMEFLFVSRSSNEETIPLEFNKMERIISKFLHQRDIHMEDYLLQEGGDITNGSIQRRYVELNGTTLLSCHEMTKTPIISINLLNIERITSSCSGIIDDEDSKVIGERKFTNWTDVLLFGDHIKLHFFDKETITFTSQNSNIGIQQWYNTLQEVISLNVSHQPWVKKICQ